MKKIINVQPLSTNIDVAILIGRVAIAALMLTHGLPKLGVLFGDEPVQFISFLGLTPTLSFALVVFAEVFCSILLLVGFATRLAVIPLIITMLVAVFYAHAADPFAKQEPGLHFLLVYVMLALTGSGKFSIDYLLQGKRPELAYQKAKSY